MTLYAHADCQLVLFSLFGICMHVLVAFTLVAELLYVLLLLLYICCQLAELTLARAANQADS